MFKGNVFEFLVGLREQKKVRFLLASIGFFFHSPLARRKKKEKEEKVAKSPQFLHGANAEASTSTAASQNKSWAEKNNALVTVFSNFNKSAYFSFSLVCRPGPSYSLPE
jgi:hypothetical protein